MDPVYFVRLPYRRLPDFCFQQTRFAELIGDIKDGTVFTIAGLRVRRLPTSAGWVLETDWSYDHVRFLYSFDNLRWAAAIGIPNTEDFSASDFQFTDRQYPDPQNEGQYLNEGWLIGYQGNSPYGTAHLYHTVNGGRSWSLVLEDPDSWFHEIYFLDKDHGWITKTWGMLTTTDGGRNWESHDFTESLVMPHRLRFTDSNNGWTSMPSEGLYHTSDGGSSWAEQKTSDGIIRRIEKIFMINSNIGFLVGLDGKIYKTTTGGD